MVAVDDSVAAGKVPLAGDIQKDGAAGVPCAIHKAVEIEIIVLTLNHRVVDGGVGAVYPTHHIRALGQKLGEIHTDGRMLSVILFLVWVCCLAGDKAVVEV